MNFRLEERIKFRFSEIIQQLLERERDRWFVWFAVSMAFGAGGYFALPREPILLALIFLTFIGYSSIWLLRNQIISLFVALLFAAFMTGLTAAKLKSDMLDTPLLQQALAGSTVKGWIEQIEYRDNGKTRITISVHSISRLSPEDTPTKVRVNIRKISTEAIVGSPVTFKAWLAPPRGPVAPGAYDFARASYFAGIGANGSILGAIETWSDAPKPSFGIRFHALINLMRHSLADRILDVLPSQDGAVAVALITGLRDRLSEGTLVSLRDAGLAHVLAISGMHMSLIAGTIFWLARVTLAASSYLALTYPIKKIAASTALVGAFCYLLISGYGIATQRAFIMISIMLLAILCNRPAITIRNVAIAAVIVVLLESEAVITPGFQMSFAATTALVLWFEQSQKQREKAGASHIGLRGGFHKFAMYLKNLILTSTIASMATAPFVLYHFQRYTLFGVFGNLLALPIVAFLVMPFGLISVLAIPFGLEPLVLPLMGQAIELVLWFAKIVSVLPGAQRLTSAIPTIVLIILTISGFWIGVWRQNWRYLGAIGVCLGVFIAQFYPKPTILIGPKAKTLAVRKPSEELSIKSSTRSTFVAKIWLARDGDGRPPEQVSDEGIVCDELACKSDLPGGGYIVFINHRAALEEACTKARIIVTVFELNRTCEGPQLLIDKAGEDDFKPHAIWVNKSEIKSLKAGGTAGSRPWN